MEDGLKDRTQRLLLREVSSFESVLRGVESSARSARVTLFQHAKRIKEKRQYDSV